MQARRKHGLAAIISSLVVALGAGHTAQAQEATVESAKETPVTLEAITVTARKRVESMQDVPVTIAAISKADLTNNLATDLSSIGELAPQVIIGRSLTGTGDVLTIRGISSAATDSGVDQSVSISMDGVSLSRARIVESAQFDMRQVEVLEGPQALFFGKNSPAGVISMESNDPTSSFEGYVKGGYEYEAEEKYGEFVLSGPIASTLKARLAFRYDYMDGWLRNIAPAEPNPFQPSEPLPGALQGNTQPKGDEVSGRLTLQWEPTDDFSAKLKLTTNSERLNSNSAYADTFCTNGQTVPTILGVPEPHASCALDMTVAESALPGKFAINFPYGNGGIPFETSDLQLASVTLDKSFHNMDLTSTTGYYNQVHHGASDGDFSEFIQIYGAEGERYRLINEELRLNTSFDGPLNAMVGAYYEHSNLNWANIPGLLNIYNPVALNYTSTTTTSESSGDSLSGFAQVRWKIVPSLELAGGARYSNDVKRSAIMDAGNSPALPALGLFLYPDNTPINSHYKSDNVSPEVTLTWKPDPNQTLYAAFKEGYKAGGISNADLLQAGTTSSSLVFGPEKTTGFEVGYKADLFRTLRVDLSAYRYDYNGLQVSAFDTQTISTTIRNAAKALTYGLTGSLQWQATDHLAFNGNFGWNHARYVSFPNDQCYVGQTPAEGCIGGEQNVSGKALNRAPDVTFRTGGDYKLTIVPGWTADLSISGSYSSSYTTETDYGSGGDQAAYWLLNAGLHISPENEKFQISLVGRDLTNTYYKVVTFSQTFGTANMYNPFLNRPREIALEALYHF